MPLTINAVLPSVKLFKHTLYVNGTRNININYGRFFGPRDFMLLCAEFPGVNDFDTFFCVNFTETLKSITTGFSVLGDFTFFFASSSLLRIT